MPEGPETVKAARQLYDVLFDGTHIWPTLHAVYTYGHKHPEFEIEKLLPALGTTLQGVRTKGKYYFLTFESGHALCAHHGMDGYWSFGEVENIKHVHVRIDFLRGNGQLISLWWVNKLFGHIYALNQNEYQAKLNSIAPALIGDHKITPQLWLDKWRSFSPNTKLRVLLMDQDKLCSGIGNYLIAEIFYQLKIQPEIEIGRFGNSQFPESFDNILLVYEVCRKTMLHYLNSPNPKLVYGQKFSPLGNSVISQKIGGRTFWWCPAEQTII